MYQHVAIDRRIKHGAARGRRSGEYRSWRSMKERCFLRTHRSYSSYGGRGITVCARWRASFEAFFADMGRRPSGTTLDRINPDGDYAPGNCRWADAHTQRINRRAGAAVGKAVGERNSTAKLTPKGVLEMRALFRGGQDMTEIARRYGVDRSSASRAIRGKSWQHLIESPK